MCQELESFIKKLETGQKNSKYKTEIMQHLIHLIEQVPFNKIFGAEKRAKALTLLKLTKIDH